MLTREERNTIACIPQKNADGSTNLSWRRARLGCLTGSEIHNIMMPSKKAKELMRALAEGQRVTETKTDFNKRLSALKKENMEEYTAALEKGQEKENIGDYTVRIMFLKGSAEAEPFADTAKGYLFKVAAERNMREVYKKDDVLFEEYIQRTSVFNSAMRWGQEIEDMAREAYMQAQGCEVTQVGFLRHLTLDWFGDSPDGLVTDEDGKPIGAVEIKCPKPETWMKYKYEFANGHFFHRTDNEILKEIKPEYYWQCQSHCECAEVDWTDFVFYDPSQIDGLQVHRIYRDDKDIQALTTQIEVANKWIDKYLLHEMIDEPNHMAMVEMPKRKSS